MEEPSFTDPLDPLTNRETDVLRLLAEGHSNKEVAVQLVISVGTVKWYVQQIYSKLGVNRRTQAIARARELKLLETVPAARLPPKHRANIPVQTTSFIGREADLAEIKRLLLDEQGCRLLTLLGSGGIGKSRLALAACAQVLSEMPDGVYFVPLAPISEADDIVPAIAQSLNFTFYGKKAPTEQLLDYLQSKKLLLVLDNFEHLLGGTTLLPAILEHAPDILLLTTSRERLNLKEEWIYPVTGLAYPSNDDVPNNDETHMSLEAYEAVRLFLQRARQTQASFSPTGAELIEIVRICQLVEGMPLGLELAAGWVHTLGCHDIAMEIERSLDFLTSSQHNIPERHKSLRAVINQTWQRLSADEQAVMSQISVFRGGCTREAAQAVTKATLPILSSLIDKALLRRTDTGRYEIHELLRQFSEEQLARDAEQVKRVRERHREYFIAFLEARTANVKGGRQKETLNEISADVDNVRPAWRRSVAQYDAQAIVRAAECLFVFYLYSSGHFEGQVVFRQAFAAFVAGEHAADSNNLPDELDVLEGHESLAGFLLACQGYFLGRTIDPFTGEALIAGALELIRRAREIDRHKEAFALQWMGWMLALQGRTVDVLANIEPGIKLLRETGDKWAEAWALLNWANNLSSSEPLEAELIYEQGMAICHEIGDQTNLGYYCQIRSACNSDLGRFTLSKQLADEAVRIFEEMDSVLGLGYALRSRGAIALQLGEYERGIHDLQHAIENFSEVRTEYNVIWARRFLGIAFRLTGDYRQAEQHFQWSLRAARARSYTEQAALSLVGLGCLAHVQGHLDRAEEHLQEALPYLHEQQLEVRIAMASSYLASVLVDMGKKRYNEAEQYFYHAFEISRRLKLVPTALHAYVGLAKLKVHINDIEQAVELATLAEHHTSSPHETRELARQILNQLGPTRTASGSNQVESQDLWAVVQEILNTLDTANDDPHVDNA